MKMNFVRQRKLKQNIKFFVWKNIKNKKFIVSNIMIFIDNIIYILKQNNKWTV